MTTLNDSVIRISEAIDASYPPEISEEAHRWRRCMKVVEEAGEVTEALYGLVGENARKGTTHDLHDVRNELFDVALSALGAVAHLDGNVTDVISDFENRASFLLVRLLAAIGKKCPGKVGSKPFWMGVDQWDGPCDCILPFGHDGDCVCDHTCAVPDPSPAGPFALGNQLADDR